MERNGFEKIMILDIFSRLTIHDIHQFEVKLEYNLEELEKTNNYKIETFFFIPRSLQINRFTYPHEEFYADLQNHIRFKTPSYSFKLILDPKFDKSPLNNVVKILNLLEKEEDLRKKSKLNSQCIKELKLLGAMTRARFRDFHCLILRKLSKIHKENDYILKRLEEAISGSISILEQLRKIRKTNAGILSEQKDLLKYFRLVEEFVSYLVEEDIISIIKSTKDALGEDPKLIEITNNFKVFCNNEKTTRREEGYHLIFENTVEHKERYIYYMGQYKKAISSVLYLEIVREKKKSSFVQLISSLAAFIASILYFIIASYISRGFAIDSLPFILLISIGYVFKDRLKDLIKIILNPRVLSRFPDQLNLIQDISEEGSVKLGEIREKVFFTSQKKIDPVVFSMRDKTRPSDLLPEELLEDIMVYQKEININTQAIREKHTRTVNIADIMRFNIHKYLEKMDDPKQIINYFDQNSNQISETTGDRTYHINVVLKYSRFRQKTEDIRYERYRIIANKMGIVRVEFVE